MYLTFFSVAIPYKTLDLFRQHVQIVDSINLHHNQGAIRKVWSTISIQLYLALNMVYLYFACHLSEMDRIARVDLLHFVFYRKGHHFVGFSAGALWVMSAYFYYGNFLSVKPQYIHIRRVFMFEQQCEDLYISPSYKGRRVDEYVRQSTLRLVRTFQIFPIMLGELNARFWTW